MRIVVVFSLVLCYLHQCNSGEYWVRPVVEHLEHEHGCLSNQFCLTLSEYVQNSTEYFNTDATFHFLPGTHTVTKSSRVIIRGIRSVAFITDSYNHSQQLPATVNCTRNKLMFAFVEVEDLHIFGLQFLNCGLEIPRELLPNELLRYIHNQNNSIHAALLFVSVTTLALEKVSVRKSYGYGLLSCNLLTVRVVGCSFHCNNWRVGRMYPCVDICADE